MNDPGRKSFTLFNAKPFTIVQDLYKLDIREIFNRGIVHVFWSLDFFHLFLLGGLERLKRKKTRRVDK